MTHRPKDGLILQNRL